MRVEGAPESDVNATLPSGKIRRAGGRRSGGYESDDAHLDGIDGFVAGADGTDDDDGVAFAKPFLVEEGLDGEADVFVEIDGIKLGDEGEDAPIEGEFLGDVLALADGVDEGILGPEPGKIAGHAAAADEGDDGVGAEFVGHDDGAFGDFFAGVNEFGVFGVIGAAASLWVKNNFVRAPN